MTKLYDLGQALCLLHRSSRQKQAAAAELSYGLKGKLELSRTGWILLKVPNALGHGAFQALNEPGAEMPKSETSGQYKAHISVIRPEELESVGGAAAVTERGKEFSFTLGPVREVNPAGWDEVNKCWFIEVRSPELDKLRKSYGLDAPKYPYHITFAVRRKGVLRIGDKSKGRSLIHHPSEFGKAAADRNCPGCGRKFPKGEPYPDVEMCEACERFGPPKKESAVNKNQIKEASARGVRIDDSPIDGKGLFASRDFEEGDVVVTRGMTIQHGLGGQDAWEQSEESRFTNHSSDPNIELVVDGDAVQFVATRNITKGEEITGDYDTVPGLLGVRGYLSYQGRPYNGESTSGRHRQYDGEDVEKPNPITEAIVGVDRRSRDSAGEDGANRDPAGGAEAMGARDKDTRSDDGNVDAPERNGAGADRDDAGEPAAGDHPTSVVAISVSTVHKHRPPAGEKNTLYVVTRDCRCYNSFMDPARWTVTISNDGLVNEEVEFQFSDPVFLGRSYSQEEPSRQEYMVEFFAYETIGEVVPMDDRSMQRLAQADFS